MHFTRCTFSREGTSSRECFPVKKLPLPVGPKKRSHLIDFGFWVYLWRGETNSKERHLFTASAEGGGGEKPLRRSLIRKMTSRTCILLEGSNAGVGEVVWPQKASRSFRQERIRERETALKKREERKKKKTEGWGGTWP